MKKLLLITAMFMAMNTWSAEDYSICTAFESEPEKLYSCAKNALALRYTPAGGLVVYEVEGKVIWAQAFYRY